MSSDLLTTILWLGSSAAISGLIAWLLANWEWFANLGDTNPLAQQAIELVIAIAMSLTSWALATYVPSDTIQKFQPVWAAIAAAINVVMMKTAQGAHVRWTNWLIPREILLTDNKITLLEKKARLKALATPPHLRAA